MERLVSTIALSIAHYATCFGSTAILKANSFNRFNNVKNPIYCFEQCYDDRLWQF
ncbi:MAG: hypothetical protein HC895_23635 [Leptolyngbyaceae cyanobacterium SM1_3_5]|nr:hypothetical protein [Leptolyngbyaceae cyanobacterium SM1_3_5]